MTKYAVAYINNFDNDLSIEIVEAMDIIEAVTKHPQTEMDYNSLKEAIGESDDELSALKKFFFDMDASIDVVEL